jgi:hypothetical protein
VGVGLDGLDEHHAEAAAMLADVEGMAKPRVSEPRKGVVLRG